MTKIFPLRVRKQNLKRRLNKVRLALGDNRAFTLTEMLVVIALIALIALFALPKLSNTFRISINSSTRNLASTIREAYNATMITGKVHRLAYDLDKQAYWVESGPDSTLLESEKSRETQERRKRFSLFSEKPKKSGFKIEKSITRKIQTLPSGVIFKDVFTEQTEEPVTKGLAYTHFFPHGLTEQTLIHLEDGEQHRTTLVISPLIGKTSVLNYYAEREEVFGKK